MNFTPSIASEELFAQIGDTLLEQEHEPGVIFPVVDFSTDGRTALLMTPQSAYVSHKTDADNWSTPHRIAQCRPEDSRFRTAVLSGDGSTALITVQKLQACVMVVSTTPKDPNDLPASSQIIGHSQLSNGYGGKIALNHNGTVALIAAMDQGEKSKIKVGAVYLIERGPDGWSPTSGPGLQIGQGMASGGHYGIHIALDAEGKTALVLGSKYWEIGSGDKKPVRYPSLYVVTAKDEGWAYSNQRGVCLGRLIATNSQDVDLSFSEDGNTAQVFNHRVVTCVGVDDEVHISKYDYSVVKGPEGWIENTDMIPHVASVGQECRTTYKTYVRPESVRTIHLQTLLRQQGRNLIKPEQLSLPTPCHVDFDLRFETAVIALPEISAVYLSSRSGDTWGAPICIGRETRKSSDAKRKYGVSVRISGDGNVVFVGQFGYRGFNKEFRIYFGSVYAIYKGFGWTSCCSEGRLIHQLVNTRYGHSIETNYDGSLLFVSAAGMGRAPGTVYALERQGPHWEFQESPGLVVAHERNASEFGHCIALSPLERDTLLIYHTDFVLKESKARSIIKSPDGKPMMVNGRRYGYRAIYEEVVTPLLRLSEDDQSVILS